MDSRTLPRFVAAVALVCLALAPLAGQGIAEENPSSLSAAGAAWQSGAPLPLTAVTLYSSGIGHFVHDGTVDGDAEVTLFVPVDEINDFLKSLVVQDLGGGTVGVVRYGAREPVDRALRSFAIDLSENPDLAAILSQARGEEVEVVAERTLTGSIVSVTTRTEVTDGVRREIASLALNTQAGIETVDLPEVRRLRFLREALQEEFRRAVATLARDRRTDERPIRLRFRGSGTRRVRIGYVRQTPVWKTSYRLVLGAESQIQAWAVVENTTGEDWEDVSLSLVTGAPISFRMNLYDPVFIERPEVPPPVRRSVVPQTYAQETQPGAASRNLSIAPRALSFAAEPREDVALDLSLGVTEQSGARDLGVAFAYDISEPVSIERYTSALVPIVNRDIQATMISIYEHSVLAGNPLLGAELSNTTGVHLMPGPVSVFDDSGYAGDAQIGDLPPDASAVLSYAIDLDVGASVSSSSEAERIRRLRIVNGVLEASEVSRRRTSYILSNRGRDEREIVIQHPKSQGWELTSPESPDAETANEYRFRVDVERGESRELEVVMERVRSRRLSLSDLGRDRIAFYIESTGTEPDVRRALERLVELQTAVSEAQRRRSSVEEKIQSIYRDQERIRSNLESLESGSRLYDRYVSTLNEQEDELERLEGELEQAKAAEEEARKELSDYISNLSVG